MYYCFFCNKTHSDEPTEEHFIPKSLGCPKKQWIPVCSEQNGLSNELFDNKIRDVLFMGRFFSSQALVRNGIALLGDGSQKKYKFRYSEEVPTENSVFEYILDEDYKRIPPKDICAIGFPMGFLSNEKDIYCKEIVKISLGTLVYRLLGISAPSRDILAIMSQDSINSLRHAMLDLEWKGNSYVHSIGLGRSDVLVALQGKCTNAKIRNHFVEVTFSPGKIHFAGMLYSEYGWKIDLINSSGRSFPPLDIENPLVDLKAPEKLSDKSQTPDSLCIINPQYIGERPPFPDAWLGNGK